MIFGFNTDVKHAETVYHVQSEARQHELLLQTQVFVRGRCIGKHTASYADKTAEPGFSEQHMQELLKQQHKHFVTAVRDGRIEAELTARETEEDELKAAAAAFAEPEAVVTSRPAPAQEIAAPASPSLTLTPAAVNRPPDIAPEPTPTDDPAAQIAAGVADKPVDLGLSLIPKGSVIGKGISLECLPPAATPDGTEVTVCVQVADENGPAGGAQVSCRITCPNTPARYIYATSSPSGIADIGVSLNGLDLSATALLIQATYRDKSASRRYQLKRS